jgi:transposase
LADPRESCRPGSHAVVEVRMITIGVDAHKWLNAAVAVDEAGRVLGQWRGDNDTPGWAALLAWATALGPDRRWGIEGAWGYGRGLAQFLVAAEETVYDVNPRWTAEGRRRARSRAKSDGLDARAIAAAVVRESVGLPRVGAEDETAILDLLVSERDGALAEATRLRNQLHAVLQHLDPRYRDGLRDLRRLAGARALLDYRAPADTALARERAATVRRLAKRLELALGQAAELETQITARAAACFSPLTKLPGVRLLTAGALASILGPGRRFVTEAQLAAYAGAAPLETSSAGHVRHRLNRGGNRRLNAILHRIAVTQLRCSPEAQRYVARRRSEGKSQREAIRALKRFLVRAVWRRWQECQSSQAASSATAAA